MTFHAASPKSSGLVAGPTRPKMRSPRKLRFRTAAAIGAVLTAGALSPLAHAQDIWTGLGDGVNWFSAGNWSTGLPNSSDNVIDVASAINFNGGGATINSFGTGVGTGGLLTISSGTLSGASLTSAFSDAGGVLISGGTLSSFTTDAATTITLANNGGNAINGLTVNGVLNDTNNGYAVVTGGLTVNGTLNLDSGGRLIAGESETFGGAGNILFGTGGGSLTSANNVTLTIGTGFTVDGQNGTIQTSLINNGTIASDGGGTITITNSNITNNSTLKATLGSTLYLNGDVIDNSGGGVLDSTNGGTLLDYGTQLKQATIQGSGSIQLTNNGGNVWTGGATLKTTTVDLSTQANSYLDVQGGLSLTNTNINVDNGGRLLADGTQSFTGTGTIALGPSGAASGGSLSTTNGGTLTIGNGITVDGKNATLAGSFINDGLIASDSGGTITSANSTIVNNTIIKATNDSTLAFSAETIDNTNGGANNNGVIQVDHGSLITWYGGAITGGTIQGGGSIQYTNNGGNVWIGGTLGANTTIDLSTNANSYLDIQNGLTIDGSVVNINNAGRLIIDGSQTISGSADIVLGAAGGSISTGTSTLTIGSGITIDGSNGTLSGSFINNGLIASDAGGTITSANSTITNNTLIKATNDSTLAFSAETIDNTNNGANNNGVIEVDHGSLITWYGGAITGGTIQGGGSIQYTNNGGNVWIGGTLGANTTIDLSTNANSYLDIQNGLTIDGSVVNINNAGRLIIDGSQTISGSADIVLGAAGGSISTGSSTLTIANGITIDGSNGTLSGSFINNGLIASDAGGTITSANSTIVNNTIIKATNDSTLAFSAETIDNTNGGANNNGVIQVDHGSLITWYGGAITGGTIQGGGSIQYTNNGGNVWNGGTLGAGTTIDLSTNANSYLDIQNGLTIDGSVVNINNAGRLIIDGSQTISGSADIVLGAAGGSISTGSSTLTIGSGITIDGSNGTLSGAFINNGLIASDAGGTITSASSTITNNTLIKATNDSTLAFVNETIDNTNGGANNNGVIEVDHGSLMTWYGGTITGGTIQGGGSIQYTNNGGNVWNGGTLGAGTTLDLSTNGNSFLVVNSGGLTVNGTAAIDNAGRLYSGATQTFGGNGNITFGAGTGLINIANLTTLTIGSGLTVEGQAGTIQGDTLVNDGTITSNVNGGVLSITTGAITNNGLLQATNGGSLDVLHDILNYGTVNVGAGGGLQVTSLAGPGTLVLNGGTGTLNVVGGTLTGGGVIDGNVNIGSGGTVAPGDPQIMTIHGNYIQTGNYLDEIEGVTPGVNGFDQLNISGNANLGTGSTLTVDLLNGFGTHLFVGEEFNIMNYGSLTGNFSSIVSDNSGYTYSFMDNGTGNNGELIVDSVGSIVVVTGTPEPGALGLFSGLLTTGAFWYRRRRNK